MLSQLKKKSAFELDILFRLSVEARLPLQGNYAGAWLAWIDNAGSRRPFNRISQALMFQWTPFGITFSGDGTGIWYFFNPALAIGDFSMRVGASAWRETDAVCLDYNRARLPGIVRGMLYDEVKVLDDSHALGIGGFKGRSGEGDNFYFLLTRV